MSPRRIVTFDYDEAAAFLADQGYDLIVVGSDTVFQMRPFCAGPAARQFIGSRQT